MINSKRFTFAVLTTALLLNFNSNASAKSKVKEMYPSKTKFVIVGHSLYDPEGGTAIRIDEIQASGQIKDESGFDYNIENVLGRNGDNSWCIHGDGVGAWIKVTIPSKDPLGIQKGMMNVYSLLMTNGLVTYYGKKSVAQNLENLSYEQAIRVFQERFNQSLYYANNRIKKIKVEFSDGQEFILNMIDGDLLLQRFIFNIKAKWVKLTILETYRGQKYNDTCISYIAFETKWPIQ